MYTSATKNALRFNLDFKHTQVIVRMWLSKICSLTSAAYVYHGSIKQYLKANYKYFYVEMSQNCNILASIKNFLQEIYPDPLVPKCKRD